MTYAIGLTHPVQAIWDSHSGWLDKFLENPFRGLQVMVWQPPYQPELVLLVIDILSHAKKP